MVGGCFWVISCGSQLIKNVDEIGAGKVINVIEWCRKLKFILERPNFRKRNSTQRSTSLLVERQKRKQIPMACKSFQTLHCLAPLSLLGRTRRMQFQFAQVHRSHSSACFIKTFMKEFSTRLKLGNFKHSMIVNGETIEKNLVSEMKQNGERAINITMSKYDVRSFYAVRWRTSERNGKENEIINSTNSNCN